MDIACWVSAAFTSKAKLGEVAGRRTSICAGVAASPTNGPVWFNDQPPELFL